MQFIWPLLIIIVIFLIFVKYNQQEQFRGGGKGRMGRVGRSQVGTSRMGRSKGGGIRKVSRGNTSWKRNTVGRRGSRSRNIMYGGKSNNVSNIGERSRNIMYGGHSRKRRKHRSHKRRHYGNYRSSYFYPYTYENPYYNNLYYNNLYHNRNITDYIPSMCNRENTPYNPRCDFKLCVNGCNPLTSKCCGGDYPETCACNFCSQTPMCGVY